MITSEVSIIEKSDKIYSDIQIEINAEIETKKSQGFYLQMINSDNTLIFLTFQKIQYGTGTN